MRLQLRGLLAGLIICLLAVSLSANSLVDIRSVHLQGMVIDDAEQPIVGASVILVVDGRPLSGVATDANGRFSISLAPPAATVELRVSSIGFKETRQLILSSDFGRSITVTCPPSSVELAPITVRPAPEPSLMRLSIPSRQITSLSSRSLVVTNPTAALQYPQIAKIGSTHSTQIRINGTSPIFHLNGIPIGTDPNHFGMFSVVPATIVDEIDFRPQGTDASFALPSIIDFKTISAFEDRSTTELNFSTMELTGTLRRSSHSGYLIGATRKSILDHILKSLDADGKQATIPPTSFTDLFLSTGLQISPHWQVGLDQYHVRDYLAFNTASTSDIESHVQTYQRARESYLGLRVNGLFGNTILTSTLAIRNGRRSYQAIPDDGPKQHAINVDLKEDVTTILGTASAEMGSEQWTVKVGGQIEAAPGRHMQLTQRYWNILPPFNTSDNPYIYQMALNQQFGALDLTTNQRTTATFASLTRRLGPLSLTGGVRHQTFAHLAGGALVPRVSATWRTGEQSNLTLFYGGFAEDPVTTILEPYQPIIRVFAATLQPVRTDLVSAEYAVGPAKLGLFRKSITDLPEMAPDFAHAFSSPGHVSPEFLSMRSQGTVDFRGGSVSLDLKRFLSPRMTFYGSYAYTEATRTEHGVTFPYEANATHRMQTQVEYALSRKVRIGSELFVRSGYHYSPTRQVMYFNETSHYTEEFYNDLLATENSLTFPTNTTLNLYANFSLGNVTLNLAITNATNRYNPIIKSTSGYIYDAGLLPSVGLRWQL